MGEIVLNLRDIQSLLLSLAALISAVSVIVAFITKAYTKAHEPQVKQDAEISKHSLILKAHEERIKEILKYLDNDNERLQEQEQSNRIIQQALLAILDHESRDSTDKKLEEAKKKLEDYLIQK